MEKIKIKDRIIVLRELIDKYNNYYYSENSSIVSDSEYDILMKELEELERKYLKEEKDNFLSLKVGSTLKNTKFTKVIHKSPMLSLSNSYNIGEVLDFIKKVEKNIIAPKISLSYDLELKLDGISISLIYEDGELVKGITRGDGKVGEDVTENIMSIESIPKKLKEKISLEVRGEIILPISKFNTLNIERLENGEEIFANPRNAAAGTLRQLDSEIVKKRGLDGYFYFLLNAESFGFTSHLKSIEYLEKLGFKTTGICEKLIEISSIEERIKYWEKEKEKLNYETDGLVLKVDNLEVWDELGNTTKAPRWAIAYKFPAKQVTTKLLGITWQVGRTGKITPVAELEKVTLSGSSVKRASLHNYDEIIRKDIKIGDTIFIEKAAEIIPQVVSVVKEVRTGEEIEIPIVTNCPSCDSILIKEEDTVDLKCNNLECIGKKIGRIKYFVSRDGMNVTGFGDKLVEKFIELGYLNDCADIYNLKNLKKELLEIEKLGEKSIEKLLEAIENSKKASFEKVLYSLGISHIGKYASKILAEKSKNIDNLISMELEDIREIEGIGKKGSESIYYFFKNEENLKIIEKLKGFGVEFSILDEEKNTENFLEFFVEKTFLITGKLSLGTRNQVQDLIKKLGGTNSVSINKKLDYLIVGEDAGSKLKKAEKIESIKILTEQEFFNIVETK